jgi:hypothetical protein
MLICSDEELWESLPDDPRKAPEAEYNAWFEKWGGAGKVSSGGAELETKKLAKTIRAGEDGRVVVTDGPYIEAKETVGGVVILEAESIDEATEVASTWPGLGFPGTSVEVRPVIEHDM